MNGLTNIQQPLISQVSEGQFIGTVCLVVVSGTFYDGRVTKVIRGRLRRAARLARNDA
jgi:hypothetical protein